MEPHQLVYIGWAVMTTYKLRGVFVNEVDMLVPFDITPRTMVYGT